MILNPNRPKWIINCCSSTSECLEEYDHKDDAILFVSPHPCVELKCVCVYVCTYICFCMICILCKPCIRRCFPPTAWFVSVRSKWTEHIWTSSDTLLLDLQLEQNGIGHSQSDLIHLNFAWVVLQRAPSWGTVFRMQAQQCKKSSVICPLGFN